MVDINDWYDLRDIENDLAADYVLQADLTKDTAGYNEVATSFTPITDGTDGFTGSLDGNGYLITDLTIDSTSDGYSGSYTGLFETNSGTIQNILLTGSLDSGTFKSGPLAGFHGGTIESCVVNMDVTASNAEIGGLVGENGSGATTTNCYALGSVEGSEKVGGFAGVNRGVTQTSYSVGSVNATTGTAENGFIGETFGTETDCYWDTESSGVTTTAGTATGLTTSEMQGSEASTNMGGFDFTNTWSTITASDTDAAADGYPILQDLGKVSQLYYANNLDVTLSVETDSATNVQPLAADLNGELLESNGDVDVYFEYGNNLSDNTSATQTISPQTFTQTVGLQADSSYEFRAVAKATYEGFDIVETGSTLTFSNGQASIDGTVTVSGNVVEGAVVQARSLENDTTFGRQETDANGNYSFDNISALTNGDIVEIIIDIKRQDSKNYSRSIYPVVTNE